MTSETSVVLLGRWWVRNGDPGNDKEMKGDERERQRRGTNVKLESHAGVDRVIGEGDVVLVDVVPLLNAQLVGAGACHCGNDHLQLSDGVVGAALDPDLLAKTIVEDDLDHLLVFAHSPTTQPTK